MFYLLCMKIPHGAWASAIVNPLPKIKINIMDFIAQSNKACLTLKGVEMSKMSTAYCDLGKKRVAVRAEGVEKL